MLILCVIFFAAVCFASASPSGYFDGAIVDITDNAGDAYDTIGVSSLTVGKGVGVRVTGWLTDTGVLGEGPVDTTSYSSGCYTAIGLVIYANSSPIGSAGICDYGYQRADKGYMDVGWWGGFSSDSLSPGTYTLTAAIQAYDVGNNVYVTIPLSGSSSITVTSDEASTGSVSSCSVTYIPGYDVSVDGEWYYKVRIQATGSAADSDSTISAIHVYREVWKIGTTVQNLSSAPMWFFVPIWFTTTASGTSSWSVDYTTFMAYRDSQDSSLSFLAETSSGTKHIIGRSFISW